MCPGACGGRVVLANGCGEHMLTSAGAVLGSQAAWTAVAPGELHPGVLLAGRREAQRMLGIH